MKLCTMQSGLQLQHSTHEYIVTVYYTSLVTDDDEENLYAPGSRPEWTKASETHEINRTDTDS